MLGGEGVEGYGGMRGLGLIGGGVIAYEEHGKVTGSDYGCAGYDCVSGHGEEDQDADVDAAVAGCAGGPGHCHGDEEGCEPDCRITFTY